MFFDETLVARVLLLSLGPRKKRAQDIHPFALLTRPPWVEGGDIGVYVCVYVYVECFYSITPAAQRHPLNHLLNPRPSALSPPRSRLMAFENSNIIRRSILSPLRKGDAPGARGSRGSSRFRPSR